MTTNLKHPALAAAWALRLIVLTLSLHISVSQADADQYYSTPVKVDHPTNLYWGDTHLHSTLSVDSSARGNDMITPDRAFRLAKGNRVWGNNGEPFQLSQPLDFLVVADHAENLGVMPRVKTQDPAVLQTPVGKRWGDIWKRVQWSAVDFLNAPTFKEWKESLNMLSTTSGRSESFFWQAWGEDYVEDKQVRNSVWQEVCATADRHNDPGLFTAFIGYEWTPADSDPNAPNLHRNVIFEGDKSKACQVLPYSAQDSTDVEDLWRYLADYEAETGDRVLAIPHNGNRSKGMMFAPVDYRGDALDRSYLENRQRWEPLVEVTQIKGDGEAHPLLSPDDEFADFETWPAWAENTPEKARYEYARSALKEGLEYQAAEGVNPFKFGMIGSTDSHTGISGIEEDNFTGNFPLIEPSRYRARGAWWFSASGLAAVWAQENSRTSIFAAMQRKEVYATTGTRIRLRFFGGWNFTQDDISNPNYAALGYRLGVPMGGDLNAAPAGKSPIFLIHAARDPLAANLDRIQVIKGWRDARGALHERIYNVALSDNRSTNEDGTAPPVGDTVDLESASYQNTIGDPELATTWSDPDFDPEQHAFYYVRVLEIPTPRWTAYDAAFYALENLPKQAPMIIQERAYSSPIWYTP